MNPILSMENGLNKYTLRDQIKLDDFVNDCVELVITAGVGDYSYREAITLDIMNFVLLVASADGELSNWELERIAGVFGYSFTEKEWYAYLKERNIISEQFITTPSYSFIILVNAENQLYKVGAPYTCLTKRYITELNELSRFAVLSIKEK